MLIYPDLPESEKKSNIACVVGKRRSGKSFFLKHTLIPRMNRHRRMFVIDVKGEYGSLPGAKVFTSVADGLAYLHKYAPSEFCLVFQRADIVNSVDQLFLAAKILKKILLVCDETALYVSQYAAQERPLPPFIRIITDGGHEGIDLIIVSQAAPLLPLISRDNANDIYCFNQPASMVLKAFGDYTDKVQAYRIAHLAQGEYEVITTMLATKQT